MFFLSLFHFFFLFVFRLSSLVFLILFGHLILMRRVLLCVHKQHEYMECILYSTQYTVHTSTKIDRPRNNASTKVSKLCHSSTFLRRKKSSNEIRKDGKGTGESETRAKKIIVIYLAIAQSLASCSSHTNTRLPPATALRSHFSFVDIAATAALLVLSAAIATRCIRSFPSTAVVGFNCYCSSSRLS